MISVGGAEPDPSGLVHLRKTIAFSGAAGAGAVGTVLVATVTGRVFVERIFAFCTEDLVSAGGGTLACGVSADTDAFMAQITATAFDTGEWWTAATGLVAGAATISQGAGSDATSSAVNKVVSSNIILTVGTGDITDGTIVVDIWHRPVTADGGLA